MASIWKPIWKDIWADIWGGQAPAPQDEPVPDAPSAAWYQPHEDRSARIHRQNQAVILAIVQAAAAGVFI